MKRVLSLVLVLVLALGSVPFAFAADKTAGETLQELGLAKGVDAAGNLNEEGMLTRAEMMVVLSRLLGVEEEAMNYAIPSTSKDVEGHWAAKYVAYAEQVGKWTSGTGENMFSPDAKVTTQMVAKFMMTALGYEANWDTAVADATALGLMEGVTAAATAEIKRGELFTAALNTVNTPVKDTETKLGVKLGVIKDETPAAGSLENAKVKSVKAIANNLVEVKFEAAVDAAAAAVVANYGITEKATTSNVIVVNNATVEGEKVVVLETAALKLGVGYTLTVNGVATNFSGIAKDTDVPEIDVVKGTDTGIVEVTFKGALVDKATAEDIANYSIDKEGTVVKAALNSDRNKVTLTIEGLTTTTVKNLTVQNVLSVDKVAMKKITKVFFPSFDKYAPTFTLGAIPKNNVEVTINVNDTHGIDKATAEDVANYSVDGLTIVSAKVGKQDPDNDDYYNKITITTSEQKSGTSYKLKINNLVDGSNAKNVMTKEATVNFRGGIVDKSAPSVQSAIAKTNTTIEVKYTESNLLDEATALNPANYTLDKSDFSIVEAKIKDKDDDNDKYVVVLTTTTQPEKRANFKLTVSGVADNFNNTMTKVTKSFASAVVDNDKPSISYAKAIAGSKVEVVFVKDVNKALAEDPTNYVMDKEIGSPKKAALDSNGKKVVLTFNELTAGTTYKLTVKNINNLYDVTMDEQVKSVIAVPDGVDVEAPTLSSYMMSNKSELRLEFSEKIQDPTAVITTNKGNFTFVKLLLDDKTAIYKATTATTEDVTIDTLTGIKDLAGNEFKYDGATDSSAKIVVAGTTEVGTPELLSWAQKDLRTFVLYFDKEVQPINATYASVKSASDDKDSITFNVKSDSDDLTIIKLTTDGAINENFKGTFKIQEIAKSYVDVVAKTESVQLVAGLVDEAGPVVTEIVAKDNKNITIKYDEELSSPGSYTVKEQGGGTITVSVDGFAVKDKTVTLKLTGDATLKSDKVYEVTQTANNFARDRARIPNKAQDFGTISIMGSGTAPASNMIYGHNSVSGTNVEFFTTKEFTAADVNAVSVTTTGGTIAITQVSAKANADKDKLTLKTNNETPFLKGVTYTVTFDGMSYDFTGVVEELKKEASSNYLVGYSDKDEYKYEVKTFTGDVAMVADSKVVKQSGEIDTTKLTGTGTYKIIVKQGDNVIYVTEMLTK